MHGTDAAAATRMRKTAIVLFALLTLPVFAQRQTLLSAGGSHDAGTGIETLSQGWNLSEGFRNVTISVWLNNGGGAGGGYAYLMRAIGSGVTCASEVASVRFDLPLGFNGMYTLFTGLALTPGDYWLVFSKPRRGPFSYANWATSTPQDMTIAPGVRYLGMAWVNSEDRIGEYVPASDFNVFTDQFPYQIEVTGEPSRSVIRRMP